jgi:hypothetical protein
MRLRWFDLGLVLYERQPGSFAAGVAVTFFRVLIVFKGTQEGFAVCLDTKSNQNTKRSDLMNTSKKQITCE